MIRTLGVITARGGSKGVLRKNIRPLLGKPLVAYTIEAANASRLLTDSVVSTEDEEIAAVCREHGGNVPFMRPAELAEDLTPSLPVVQHAVREMERLSGQPYDAVVLLQPTSPLRRPEDIDACIQMLVESGADSVVSVTEAKQHPLKMKRIVGENIVINYIDQGADDMRPRQALPPVYVRSGDVYVSWRRVVMDENQLIGRDCRGYMIPAERTIDIDSEFDFLWAEYVLSQRIRSAERIGNRLPGDGDVT